MDDLGKIGVDILSALSPLIIAGLGYFALKISNLIKAKTENAYLEGVLVRLNDQVFAIVKELQQTIVAQLKEGMADGKLTDDEKASIKAKAMATLKAYVGFDGLKALAKILGLGDATLDQFLSTKIEAAVHDLRLAEGVSANPTPVQPKP